MSNPQKLLWLRRVLLAKVILTLGLWGLPALLAPRALLSLFGIEMPADPIFVRLFGAVVTAFGVADWFAYRDPVRNVAIVKAGVVDNGLVTLVIVAVALTSGPPGWFFLVSAMLTAFFLVAFLVLMPQEAPATERAHQGVLSQ